MSKLATSFEPRAASKNTELVARGSKLFHFYLT